MITHSELESKCDAVVNTMFEFRTKQYKNLIATLKVMGFYKYIHPMLHANIHTRYWINDKHKIRISIKVDSAYAHVVKHNLQTAIPESVLKENLITHLTEKYLT